jgi:hypothetical protein
MSHNQITKTIILVGKAMSKLTIKERVDRLLEHGVENPAKWAIVHGYKEPDVPVDWKDEFERLRKHHLEETAFLFEMLQELASRAKANKS